MKYSLLLLIGCFCVLNLTSATKVRYDKYKVFRFTPNTQEHINWLEKLKQVNGITFWDGPSANIGVKSDVMVSPDTHTYLLQSAQLAGINNVEYISDVQKLIDESAVSSVNSDKHNWYQYSRLDKIYEYLESQKTKHNKTVTLENIGKSTENRDIKLIKISKGGKERPAIWIDSNIHAREHITGMVVTFFIDELLNGDNTELKKMLDDFDFYILPVVNPDGFEYSHTTDRLWRKTRSVNKDSTCIGTDPNRNFGYKWLTGGSSTDPCSCTHAGSAAFSEPETQALSNYYNKIANQTIAFISVHSYSQLIIFPYGLNDEKLSEEDYATHTQISKIAAAAMEKRYKTAFRVGSITDLLYAASGGSIDWVKAVHKTPYTIAFELRDTGKYGFLLPSDQIIPSGEEFIDGMIAIGPELRKFKLKNNNSGSELLKPISKFLLLCSTVSFFMINRLR